MYKVDICDELETTPMYAHQKLAPTSSLEDELIFNNSLYSIVVNNYSLSSTTMKNLQSPLLLATKNIGNFEPTIRWE
jgi:hypothetical protein